jgi:hypothetical protein
MDIIPMLQKLEDIGIRKEPTDRQVLPNTIGYSKICLETEVIILMMFGT